MIKPEDIGLPRWVYNGIPDPEKSLVKLLMQDKQRFKRTAQVVYRCRKCGKNLGFVYPVVMQNPDEPVEFGQLNDEGHLVVNAPVFGAGDAGQVNLERPKPFGPWVVCPPGPPGHIVRTWWLFTYRHIDPAFMSTDEVTGRSGFSPTGGVKGHRPGESASDEIHAVSSPGEITVVGERDVWVVTDRDMWEYEEKNPPVFSSDNPSGLINCRDYEHVLSFAEVEADIERFKPDRWMQLPK